VACKEGDCEANLSTLKYKYIKVKHLFIKMEKRKRIGRRKRVH